MEHNVTTQAPVVVTLREIDVPEDGVIKLHIPKFWLEKNRAIRIDLCENAITGNLEVRIKDRKPETGEPLKSETNGDGK